QRRNERSERELGGETEHARVHVRQRRLPARGSWNVRRVVEEGGVVVRQVVDVEHRRDAPAAKADDLLEAQVDRTVARAVHVSPAVQRAGGDEVDREWTTGQRTTELHGDRAPERIR